MTDYDKTPSFYNSTEQFQKYLAQTSYYTSLQHAVQTLAEHINPDEIVELGTGTGDTAITLSQTLPNTSITAVDNRETVIQDARNNAPDQSQITFTVGDMTDFITNDLPELTVMLYSFHHIPDPLDEKKYFLEQCCESLPIHGYLCIAETFLDELPQEADQIRPLWDQRGQEAYASTFWQSLNGVDDEHIQQAEEIAEFSREHELEAGENVAARDDEYLVSRDWLESHASRIGFNIALSKPCNALGEGVVLLQKPS